MVIRKEEQAPMPQVIRLNIGCAARPLPGYINVDMDSIEELKARYPHQEFPVGIEIHDYDVFTRRAHVGTIAKLSRLPGI